MKEIKFEYLIKLDTRVGKYIDKMVFTLDEIEKRTFTHREEMIIAKREYTGLKDKNGVEIYEGDIVTEPCHDCKNGVLISEIVFERGCFVKKEDFHGHMAHTVLYGEVIGNIYENPELLEGSK